MFYSDVFSLSLQGRLHHLMPQRSTGRSRGPHVGDVMKRQFMNILNLPVRPSGARV